MKKDSLELVETTTKSVISANDPSGGIISAVIAKGAQYFDERRDRIINQFYADLFKGIASEDDIQYMNDVLKSTEEDGYKLLNAAITDDEEEKAIYYTRLYEYILNHQQIEKYVKLNLLRTLKALSFNSIVLLKNLYIHQNYPIKSKTLQEFISDSMINPNLAYDMSILKQNGILKDAGFVGGASYEPTEILDDYIEILFKKEELTPEFNGIEVWASKILILHETQPKATELQYLKNIISKECSKSVITKSYDLFYGDKNKDDYRFFDTIICLLHPYYIKEKVIDKIYSKFHTKKIFKVKISDNQVNQMTQIDGDIYQINEKYPHIIDNFVKQLNG